MTYTPVYTTYPPPVPVPEPPLRPRRGWWILLGTAIVTVVAAIIIVVIVVSLSSTTSAPEPAQPAAPAARPFAATDETWCGQYLAISTQLADAGRAAGAPRVLASPDLPQTAWSAADAVANARFADYLTTWASGMAHLRDTATNPALQTLIDTSLTSYTRTADVIHNGTYTPADADQLTTIAAADRGLLGVCRTLGGHE